MDEKKQAYLEGFEQGARQVINRVLTMTQELTEELARTIMQEQMKAQTADLPTHEIDMSELMGTAELVEDEQ